MGINDCNVRSQVAKSLDEVSKDFFDNRDSAFNDGWYTGIVVNNNDPDKEGKCRIRVYGVFGDEIPDEHLPWALPDFNFIGSKLGSFIVPPVDALVKVYFDHGDLYLPHYSTKAVVSKSQPSQKDTDYPDNMVLFETDDGDYLTINRKSKETTYNHNSGTKVLIKKDGSVEITVEKDVTKTVKGNVTNNVEGKTETEVTSTITVKGQTVTIEGTANIVTPSGQGGFNCLPTCPVVGALHTGTILT